MSLNDNEANFLGIHFHGSPVFVTVFSVIFSAAFIANAIWIFRDAKRRGKNPWISIIFLSCGWPFSNAWWLWLRPQLPDGAKSSEPTECLVCQTVIAAGQTRCPSCGWSYQSEAD